MQNSLPNAPEIVSESAYVVYDAKTGRIVHGHSVINYKGAQQITRKEEEATVMAAAEQFGHKMEGLKLLSVPPKDLDFSVPVRVNLKTQTLMRVEAKTKSAPRKSASRKATKRKPKAKAKR